MSPILIKTVQLICCLSILIVLHEFGHYGFSKLFKVRVEKFYLFFNPKFHLFSTRDKWFTKLFPYFKDNETEYGIGWIPLGGYVKIAGMVDESMDMEQMKKEAQPDEFRSQKVWKRFFIMAGGVLMNLLTAWFIYSAVMFTWGKDYIPIRSIKDGFMFSAEAQEIGFRNGDIPVSIDGKDIIEFDNTIFRKISNAQEVTVMRAGQKVDIAMPSKGLNMLSMLQSVPPFLSPKAPAVVSDVQKGSAADKAGIKAGSRILAINGMPLNTWNDFDAHIAYPRNELLASKDCTSEDSINLRKMTMAFLAPKATVPDTVLLQLNDQYMMGVMREMPIFETAHVSYGFLQSIPAGLQQGWSVLSGYVNDLKYLTSSDGAKSVGSFITIGSIFPDMWDWNRFWMLTAFISIILAVMNILPIPGLDGGHIMILFFEAVTGRQPSDHVMEWIERIGVGLLLLLMLLAISNDVRNFIFPLFGL